MNNYFLKIMVLSAATPDYRIFSCTGDSASSTAAADLKKSVESMSDALEIHDLQTVCSAIRQANRHYGHATEAAGLAVVVDEVSVDALHWHRVRLDPLRTHAALDHARHQLDELGIAFKLEQRGE